VNRGRDKTSVLYFFTTHLADGNALNRALKLFGPAASLSTYTIRDFLHRSDVPFEYVEAEER
jgi:hypothetical protein